MKLTLLLTFVSAVSAAGFYTSEDHVKELNPSTFKKYVLESPHVSLVEFYAPWCGHCQAMKSEYIRAAKSSHGLINVAAVNCDDDTNKGLCAQYGVKSFPTVKVFQPPKRKTIKGKDGKKRKAQFTIDDYRGERSAGPMAMYALQRINNKVSLLPDVESYQKFISKTEGKNVYPKVILVSSKNSKSDDKDVPPVLKVLAIDAGTPFAFVAPDKKGLAIYEDLIGKRVSEAPEKSALFVIPDASTDPIPYDGALKRGLIEEFVNDFKGESWLAKKHLYSREDRDSQDNNIDEEEDTVEEDYNETPTEDQIEIETEYLYETNSATETVGRSVKEEL